MNERQERTHIPPEGKRLEESRLFAKVYGCLVGGAIGDALGGPVEGWTPAQIREAYGNLDRFVAYQRGPSYHAHFGAGERIGAYTDDTRLKHLLCRAIVAAQGMPRAGDFGHVLAHAYHHAPDALTEGFIEEYYLKAIWGRDKVIYSGEPTNGAIMANSPIGIMAACRPHAAYQAAFELAFPADGYAKTAAAMMAAAIAAAMGPAPTLTDVSEAAIASHLAFNRRREGPVWSTLEWRYDPNISFLRAALAAAAESADVFALQPRLYEILEWGHLFSEATHTLVVPLAMFAVAQGDFRQTVIGCVMYGRDNDSYASVAGALAGAFHGIDAIPPAWIKTVSAANPEVDMHALALELTAILVARHAEERAEVDALQALL